MVSPDIVGASPKNRDDGVSKAVINWPWAPKGTEVRSQTEETAHMVKAHLIDAIRSHNPTAPVEWLSSFSAEALHTYLDHLLTVADPEQLVWIRPGDTPAITTRVAA